MVAYIHEVSMFMCVCMHKRARASASSMTHKNMELIILYKRDWYLKQSSVNLRSYTVAAAAGFEACPLQGVRRRGCPRMGPLEGVPWEVAMEGVPWRLSQERGSLEWASTGGSTVGGLLKGFSLRASPGGDKLQGAPMSGSPGQGAMKWVPCEK